MCRTSQTTGAGSGAGSGAGASSTPHSAPVVAVPQPPTPQPSMGQSEQHATERGSAAHGVPAACKKPNWLVYSMDAHQPSSTGGRAGGRHKSSARKKAGKLRNVRLELRNVSLELRNVNRQRSLTARLEETEALQDLATCVGTETTTNNHK